jgi:tyrosine-protein phosphatase SIW14
MDKIKFVYIVTICYLVFFGRAYAAEATQPTTARPTHWAVLLKAKGLTNFYKVADGLYRGAQPSARGLQTLEKMGIKTIVDLRGLHSDSDEIAGTTLKHIPIRFHTWHPEEEDMVDFLKAVTNPTNKPVFVHCKHGADRTGTMVALYRIAVQGWTKDEAIREMTRGGFGYHSIWKNLIKFMHNLDIERLQKAAGIAPVPPVSPR